MLIYARDAARRQVHNIPMPRYFFHLHECGTVIEDDEGIELPDLESARGRAIADARDVMAAEVQTGRLCLGCAIRIHDAHGALVETVAFREAVIVSG